MSDIRQWYSEITGFESPHPHQVRVAEALAAGKSVILRAPTGSGKTEAVLVPFLKLRQKTLPSQLVYSLPMRVLVDDIGRRAASYCSKAGSRLSVQHGARPEDPLFLAPIVMATIDQTVAAYACTPLSISPRHGSIPAGAVASGFLVFDEIQLLDPQLGLQSSLLLAKHSIEMGFPVVLMTATLPKTFMDKFTANLPEGRVEVIDDVQEQDIPSRRDRRMEVTFEEDALTARAVRDELEKCAERRMIVVCNTVRRAQQLFKDLDVGPKMLLHSRFLANDRAEKEVHVRSMFGRGGTANGVLVTTQVIEAGMDISTPLILSELAPVDSIIQRAGRCARWGGSGRMVVYGVESACPYSREIVDATAQALPRKGTLLDWSLEKQLVDQVMAEPAEKEWLSVENQAQALAMLSRAAFEGSRQLAASAVRDAFTCEVSLHRNPHSLGDGILRLEKVRVPLWTLRAWTRELKLDIWSVEDSNIIDDSGALYKPERVTEDGVMPFRRYIVSSDQVGYSKDTGLAPGEPPCEFPLAAAREKLEPGEYTHRRESWVEHSMNTAREAQRLLDSRGIELSIFARALGLDAASLSNLIIAAARLHDLGKLNLAWQEKAQWDGVVPLAHTDLKNVRFPWHATASAYALANWTYANFKKDKLYEALSMAIAHHHSLRSSRQQAYHLVPNWQTVLREAKVDDAIVNLVNPVGRNADLDFSFPDLNNHKLYRTYAFIGRVLKLADWTATGGEDALLRFEDRHADV